MIDDTIKRLLICPCCGKDVDFGEELICKICNRKYPIINGIPILINEKESIFKVLDFLNRQSTTINLSIYKKSPFQKNLAKLIPSITKNLKAKDNLKKFQQLLLKFNSRPIVLIIGAGVFGVGIKELLNNKDITFVETDISFGPRTQVICDAHCLPFASQTVDGVIVQAVLEHVINPQRCVEEIYRVLKLDGLVYSETPFMQQVHMGKYDFTRFTDLGHRLLFRGFEEIERGIAEGPATSLAWSIQYFLMSFVNSCIFRKIIRSISCFFIFWLKYFDYYLIHNVSSYAGACGFYFIGRKSATLLSDIELVNSYRE
jgi:SAM-dependent methyltransferase